MTTIREIKDYKEELLDINEKSLKHIKVLSISLKEYFANKDYKNYNGTLRIMETYRAIVVNNNQKLARLSSRLEKIGGERLHY